MSHISSVTLSVLVVLLVASMTLAGRSRGKANNKQKDCSNWTFGTCQLPANKTCGEGSKLGTRSGETCAQTEKQFKCAVSCGCKYHKARGAKWTACDPDTRKRSITVQLLKGDPEKCNATKVIMKKCTVRSLRDAKGRRPRPSTTAMTVVEVVPHVDPLPAGGAAAAPRCQYRKTQCTKCDADTTTKTCTLVLKNSGDPSVCEQTKTVTKPCKKNKRGRENARPNRRQ